MQIEELQNAFYNVSERAGLLLSSTETYIQVSSILAVYFIAFAIAYQIRRRFSWVRDAAEQNSHPMRKLAFDIHKLIFPLVAIVGMKFLYEYYQETEYSNWLIQFALSVAMLVFLSQIITRFVANAALARLFKWIALPLLFLHLIDVLSAIILVLEGIKLEVGNISVSAYGLARVFIFALFLFWCGRASNRFGKEVIRKQPTLDIQTKEVLVKLLEVALFTVVVLILLNVMGINLTAFAVFGGAVGVGLGFGLQSIASNFISGLIILLDRSITVDDYIEFDEGTKGYVREFRMRYTTMETFDGKFIMVPNEKFISETFVNWSHKDLKQRFRVDFSVAYKTNIRELVDIIKAVVAEHPQVISGEDIPFEERPDCEIDSFGDSGVNMFVEFWMMGVDDGKNRVGGDLLLMIFEALREHNIEIPFPQREVRILNEDNKGD
ncbi:mechanosensitive ion channel protein [Alteromonas sediminis]|uniref:Mechanosensitive ion channel protein n=1 Tax=Alteromonas sediminis TaxID=2259342 RepID=A0A3N5Y431_9ALTE|nr:mechanosensitive ion channel domain-containing protein [Alteromonas sediminis]RPJ67676.1 mechanosensitive ion channel protein [Alteromonas sediminis]